MCRHLGEAGIRIRYLDLGGGLGITYNKEAPPHPTQYARAVREELETAHLTLILEPGRVLVGNAGILVTRVLYTKAAGEKNFIIVDAAMNDLIRPSLYGSFHGIQPVRRSERRTIKADVVGPICESGDFLAKEREVETLADRRPDGRHERRGLWFLHVLQLQLAAQGCGGDGERNRVPRGPRAGDL